MDKGEERCACGHTLAEHEASLTSPCLVCKCSEFVDEDEDEDEFIESEDEDVT